MDDEELPSESTSRPIFRRNVQKNISSTNANTSSGTSSKFPNKKVKLISTAHTKKSTKKPAKQPVSRKKKTYLQSTPKTKRSTTLIDNSISTDDDMHDDYTQTTVQQSNLNDSFASGRTDNNVSNEQSDVMAKKTTQTKEDVWKCFTRQSNGDFQCNLCADPPKVFPRKNEITDTNLRSHLGRTHKLTEFLYPSQRSKKEPKEYNAFYHRKKDLNTAAIQAIVQDSHAFNIFHKSGIQKFLSLAVPGYRGPTRQTVAKRLQHMYKKHRQTIRDDFSNVSDISLSADVWKTNRRDHFICLSAHYYDDHYLSHSKIIAFRRFLGKHSSDRIERFIINEIEKLNLETKICSLTTDNGSDIRSASRNKPIFGIRISCFIHILNLIVRNGLWLFDTPNKLNLNSLPTTNIITSTTTPSTSSTTISIPSSFTSSITTSNSSSIPSPSQSNQTSSTSNQSSSTSNKSSSTSNRTSSASNRTSSTSNRISSTSNAAKSNISTLICTDSSTDDDYDYTINDSEVTDDSGSDIASKHSDRDSSCCSTSTATSSLNDESDFLSSSSTDEDDDVLNPSLLSAIDEEKELLNKACVDSTILLLKVHIILKRLRKLIRMIHQSSVINRYVEKQMKSKLEKENLNRRSNNQKPIKYKGLKISSFLDPSTYRFLTCDDKIEAETIIINEAKAHYAKVNANSSSSNQSSTVTPINKNEQQDNQSIFLQNLFIACGFEAQTTTSIFKPSTIKEELAQYVATISSYQSFSQYWYEKKDCLPILSSI
ncbi:unnamed protein product, partial [Rotaria sp. Silwood2]